MAIPRVAPPAPRTYGTLVLPDGETVPVREGTMVLGRGAEAEIRLADPSVSRRHAEVRVEGGRVHLTDLGSTNGTTVNGRKVDRVNLSDGDRVALGSAVVTYRG
jgi:pSer/pThr/pTyr-binding forkhead associated (FHA) protein